MPACPFITVPFGLCKQILIDLYRYFGSLTGSGSFHHRADGLGNPALFADDSAHIVGAHVQMVHNHTLFIGGISGYRNCVLVFHKAFCDCH